MLRTLKQPGTPERLRTEFVKGFGSKDGFVVPAGTTLQDGISQGMRSIGLRSGTVRLADFEVETLQYVRPAEAVDDDHVAFYSATHRVEQPVRILLAMATVGEKDDKPFLHCHALWIDPKGSVRGGHLHNDAVCLVRDTPVVAWGLPNVAMAVEFDAETNFSLFRPRPVPGPECAGDPRPRCVVAKIRPNEDLLSAIESVCQEAGIVRASIVGSVGSTVGATFDDGRQVEHIPTELLVVSGSVGTVDGRPSTQLQIAVIDPEGQVHFGQLARGRNAVLICFELVLQEVRQ